MAVGEADAPRVCPKCGSGLLRRRDQSIDAALRIHVTEQHRKSIGTATAPDRDPLHFAYLRPVQGTSEAWWFVLLLDGPALITKLRAAAWSIEWFVPEKLSQPTETMRP